MSAVEKLPDQSWNAVTEAACHDEVREYLVDEIFKALGLGGLSLWRKWFGFAFMPFINVFIKKAEAFDQSVVSEGFQNASLAYLAKWLPDLRIEGREELPLSGPLLIAANHPGTLDGLAVASCLPRKDLKIVTAANPFFRALPNTRQYFIYSTLDTHVRVATVRRALRHLEGGGALLIFSSGKLDPDPRYFPDAARQALRRWSSSLELFIRKIPETRVVVAINSGFVAPEFLHHPLTSLRHSDESRQKLAEFIQVIQQVLFDRKVTNRPFVAFSQPVLFSQLSIDNEETQAQIFGIARRLIDLSSNGFKAIPGDLVRTA